MKSVFFLYNKLGLKIGRWLVANYPSDIAALVIKPSCTECAKLRDLDVNIVEYKNSKQIQNQLRETAQSFGFGFLVWWPDIIENELIKTSTFGFINTHPSYLPYCRGKNYNFWAIVDEAPFGVTLHMVDDGIDTGDIIFQKKIMYDWVDNGETLFSKAQKEMYNLFIDNYIYCIFLITYNLYTCILIILIY